MTQGNTKITGKRFKESLTQSGDTLINSPNGTIGVGPAYNLALVAARQGCIGCNEALTKNIMVD